VAGERKGEKETLARKPQHFEKPVRPRTEFPDWRGMVVLIASDKYVNQIRYVHSSVTRMSATN